MRFNSRIGGGDNERARLRGGATNTRGMKLGSVRYARAGSTFGNTASCTLRNAIRRTTAGVGNTETGACSADPRKRTRGIHGTSDGLGSLVGIRTGGQYGSGAGGKYFAKRVAGLYCKLFASIAALARAAVDELAGRFCTTAYGSGCPTVVGISVCTVVPGIF